MPQTHDQHDTYPANKHMRIFLGEFTGTFLMCFFGIGAVAVTTLFSAMTGPFQVGMVWGLTIAIAIYATRNLSCAHFNPSVSLAMCVGGRLPWRELPLYVTSQCAGAFVAAGALWGLFADSVQASLAKGGLTMSVSSPASSIWCEVFPNTANAAVTPLTAACAEGIGVFILVMVIFSVTEGCNLGRPGNALAPLFIGLTITILICVIGPLTDAGLNPARDLMPRIVGALAGWGSIAISFQDVIVYLVAPLVGGATAALYFTTVVERAHSVAPATSEATGRASLEEPAAREAIQTGTAQTSRAREGES